MSPMGSAARLAGVAGVAACVAFGGVVPAWAWGHTGHVLISQLAAQSFPRELPAFLRTLSAAREIGQLGPEPDLSKDAGNIHDFERDPGHYVDLDDSGNVEGFFPLAPLQSSRRDFDTALRVHGSTQYSGYLPYNIVDGWQQLRKDFAFYRAETIGLRTADNAADTSFFAYQLGLREKLILRDLGVWSHFVADASQPMHVSIHYNGWGPYPNPNNYTQAPIHAPFEGSFVHDYVRAVDVLAAIRPYRDCGCAIETRVPHYLLTTLGYIDQTYRLAGPTSDYTVPTEAGVRFVTSRLAAGASELRDEVVDAWRSSTTIAVGYPEIPVADIIAGKVHLTRTSFASD